MASGQDRLRKKLASAFDKVARQVGKPYNVYRPTSITNVLDEANFVQSLSASFTLDEGYKNQNKEGFSQYITYADINKIQVGDVFNDGEETFVLTWNRAADQPMAVKADALVEIWRPEWTTVGGLSQSPARYARNVPASFSSASSVSDVSMLRVNQSGQAATWEVRIWTDAEEITTSDLIIRVEDGLRLQPTSIKNNKHCQILTCSAVITP